MKISDKNIKRFTYFVVFLILVSASTVYLAVLTLKKSGITLPWYISVPSVSAIYFVLFQLFDRHIWKIGVVGRLAGVSSPNLNGKWKGYVLSSFDDFKKKYPMSMVITQSATQVTVRATYSQSKSISLNAGFEPSDVDGCDALFYFYRNEPNPDAHEDMAIHEGSAKLVYSPDKDKIDGSYYSGRDRNNFGKIHLKRDS